MPRFCGFNAVIIGQHFRRQLDVGQLLTLGVILVSVSKLKPPQADWRALDYRKDVLL